ncbi:unnamed protein product [Urochloa humidicola]
MSTVTRFLARTTRRVAARRSFSNGPSKKESPAPGEDDSYDTWLWSEFNQRSTARMKAVHELRMKSTAMEDVLNRQLNAKGDALTESKRIAKTATWRIVVVFGTVGLSTIHLVQEAWRFPTP